MNLASRVTEMVPRTFVQSDKEAWIEHHGSLSAREKENRHWEEIDKTNYRPDAKPDEQNVASDEDLLVLERMGQAER